MYSIELAKAVKTERAMQLAKVERASRHRHWFPRRATRRSVAKEMARNVANSIPTVSVPSSANLDPFH